MTKNLRHTMLAVLGTIVILAGRGLAQDRKAALPTAVYEAQSVLIAAYPELQKEPVTWRIESTPTGAIVDARRAVAPLDAAATETPPLVGATVTVDEKGRLQALHARGTLVDRVRRPIGRGPRRRAPDVDGDLKAVGAKFSPGDPTASDGLVTPGLQRLFGARTVRERSFRAEGTAEAPLDALTWRVELEADDPATRGYTLVFEPIEGRLLSVVRR
jgi:hypothetical protein